MAFHGGLPRAARHREDQAGFTLVELLTAMTLAAILLTLGALAVRQFWFVRTLHGAQDEVTFELKRLQQRVIAETHPLVYGARFEAGSSVYGLVRYDPDAGTCVEYQSHRLAAGIRVDAAAFETSDTGKFCKTSLTTPGGAAVPGASASEYVFFYARGNATPGSLKVVSDRLGRTLDVKVAGITGRVTG